MTIPELVAMDTNYTVKLADYKKKCKMAARNQTIALIFFKRAYRKTRTGLFVELENQYSRGHDNYPLDLTAAHNLLLNYGDESRNARTRNDVGDHCCKMLFTYIYLPMSRTR